MYQLVIAGFTSMPEPESWRGPGLCTLALGEKQRARVSIFVFRQGIYPQLLTVEERVASLHLQVGEWVLTVICACVMFIIPNCLGVSR